MNLPIVQNFVKDRAISYIKNKTQANISLERIYIGLPSDVMLKNFYVEDKKGDTLLFAEKLAVDISLFKLLKNTVEVNNIELKKIRANVYRLAPDTNFNFSFLVDAFASEQNKPEEEVAKDSTSTLKFALNKIKLTDIGIKYIDDVTGNDLKVYLSELNTKVKTFNLEDQHYVIDQLVLNNSAINYQLKKPLVQVVQLLNNSIDSTEIVAGKLPQIEILNTKFQNVKINYNDQVSTTKAVASINDLGLIKLSVDLTNSKYSADEATLNKSDILFAFKPEPSNDLTKVKDTVLEKKSTLEVNVKKISFLDNNIQYDNLSAKPAPQGLDFNHLKINNLNLVTENLSYNASGINVNVKRGSLIDKSGFILEELNGDAVYSDQQIILKNLRLKTPNTFIDNNTQLSFSKLEDLTKNPEKVKINLDFKNSTVGLKDAFYFSQVLPANYKNTALKINATAKGYLNNLSIPEFQISGLKNTLIDIKGNIKGLPNIEKVIANLNIQNFRTSKSDLLVLLPKNTIPNTLELPNTISAKGNFNGSMTNFKTQILLNSDMGNAFLTANMGGKKGMENFLANIQLINFNVGKLLKQQPSLGHITANANVNGVGLDIKNMNAKFSSTIKQVLYKKYTYKDLEINGNIAQQKISINSKMPDSNANFNLNGLVNLAGKYPAVKAQLDLQSLDLQKLNFTSGIIRAAGKVNIDLTTADIDYLNGKVDIDDLQLVKDDQTIFLDSINVKSVTNDKGSLLTLRSDIATARVDGKYELKNLAPALTNLINKYYAFGKIETIPDQRFRFFFRILDSELLHKFVPDLKEFKPAIFYGLLDTQKDSLSIKGNFPKIIYSGFNVDSTQLNINTDENNLSYNLKIKGVQSSSINLFNSEIDGFAKDNMLNLNVFLRDKLLKNRYVIAGDFQSINKDFKFKLDPDQLLLNYEKWIVSPANFIQFGQTGIWVNDFQISNNGQSLSINSTPSSANAPLLVNFKDFELATLTRFADADTALVGGKLNGIVNAKNLDTIPQFEANLTVDNLSYLKDALGNLNVAVNNFKPDSFEIDASLKGVHDFNVKGFYHTKPKGNLDLIVNVEQIQLKNLESLSAGQIKDGEGIITGKMTVQGELTAPKIDGDLTFKDAGVRIAYVNSFFKMPNEKISFNEKGINFNNFKLIDSLNQTAVINGDITTPDYRNFAFGLNARLNNFRLINSTAADNEMIYGTVFTTSTIRVGGNLNKPNVNMTVRINKGTKFYFAMPNSDPSVIDQEGIIQFVDFDAPPFNGDKALKLDSIAKSEIKGLELSADITIDPEAVLTVVVDPANGDNLTVKGTADLNATMDISGKISLTGRYEIVEGSYDLSVGGLAQREFKLTKGSNIVWTGEPTAANANITALYEVNAAPIDLLNDPSNVQAKTKIPIQVYLLMKGELMKPVISFKLDLPEHQRGVLDNQVYTKLQQVNNNESELNKQVFALLALNRFIASNPFQSLVGGSLNAESIARSSVSKILTDQLNNLASDLIEGVDINLGLNSSEDYSTGAMKQKTNLEVGLSKKLLNDRLTVSVGSSFGLEGPQAANKNAANIAGNVNIEYALSADGRYRLRAYRRNQNESVIEGQIIETGVGFTLVVDYNKFREIFIRKRFRQNFEQRRRNEKIN